MRVGYSQSTPKANPQIEDPTWVEDQLADLNGDIDDLMGEPEP
jgi:hypothetical protein